MICNVINSSPCSIIWIIYFVVSFGLVVIFYLKHGWFSIVHIWIHYMSGVLFEMPLYAQSGWEIVGFWLYLTPFMVFAFRSIFQFRWVGCDLETNFAIASLVTTVGSRMEMVGENNLLDHKFHHRCRRKKQDCRMVDALK